jgi:NhaP-type Na+/H+ or K+/H+ antiporter
MIAAPAAHYALGMSWQMAFLFGAIMTVTGPTVIVHMLRTVRPSSKIANILRWEGIVIDPIGALLAVLVFEYIISAQNSLSHTIYAFVLTLSVGIGFGALFGNDITYAKLVGYETKRADIKTTRLSEEFSYDQYKSEYEGYSVLLCAIEHGEKSICTPV